MEVATAGNAVFAAQISVELDFEALAANSIAQFSNTSLVFESKAFAAPDSSVYFVAADKAVGPTSGACDGAPL